MDRRTFIGIAGLGAAQGFGLPRIAKALGKGSVGASSGEAAYHSKAYGSGHFGEWITDEFGLPAYKYTCNQITDAKAISPVHKEWRSPTDHTHQVGNDRLVRSEEHTSELQSLR